MTNKTYTILAIFIGISLLLFLISYWWLAFQKLGELGIDTRNIEKTSQQIIKRQITQDNMVQENSLVARSPVEHIRPIILAVISEVNPTIYLLAKCESGLNPLAWNKNDPNGGSFGILQYQIPTFQRYCVEKYGLKNDIWDSEIQIECCEKMLSEGLLHHWSCGKKILDN